MSSAQSQKNAMIDVLLHNALIVTVDPVLGDLSGGALAVRGGTIEKVWQPAPGEALPEARETIDLAGNLVMPGLVNAHTHLPMTLFRGLADDLPLSTWLNEHIFPAEARHVTPESVQIGARLACAEMLLSGTTTCCDGYFLADASAQAVAETGVRAVLGQGVIDFPAPGVSDPSRNVAHAAEFVAAWQDRSPLLRPSIFCHSPYTCSARTLQAAKKAAGNAGVLFQIHTAETRAEAEQCRAVHGCSPVGYLQRLGLLDPHTLLVHVVWVDSEDIHIVADSGAAIAHCPQSNMKLGSGVAPLPDFMAAGIAVGLGTDGCASNNDLDLFGEMDTAAKLHKVQRLDPTVMDAAAVVHMATLGASRAIGLGDRIGSLTPGKQADLIVIDLNQPHLTPLYHPASHLVYTATGADVRDVMVAGRWQVRDRRLLGMDVHTLMQAAAALARTIASAGRQA
jgi:5-methylthioadenosine/S-adenosylhomocysteine deaminase